VIWGLSIAGDIFWILALAVMSTMSWAASKRIPKGLSAPVAWRDGHVLLRAPKWAALWLLIVVAFAIGAWLKIESRNPNLTTNAALIWLGVRATVAPLLATLHLTQVRRGLETLEREGSL